MGERVRKVAGWLCIGIILAWAGAFLVMKTVHDRVTQNLVSVADEFVVPSDWTLIAENIETEKLICLNGNPCPSLHRRWQANEQLAEIHLHLLAATAGWDFSLDRDCVRHENVFGSTTLCSATGSRDGYDYIFRINSPEPGADSTLILNVQPARVALDAR
ncbi:hypothetical protein GCM10027404_12420 [Arthrobacter tumbae]